VSPLTEVDPLSLQLVALSFEYRFDLGNDFFEALTPELLCMRLDEWILERVRGYENVKVCLQMKNF